MAKRYQPSELIGEQGGVQTFSGRDVVNGLPVRLYSFMGEPTSRGGELKSEFIPPILSSSFSGRAGEVVSAFSGEFKQSKGAVTPGLVEVLLRHTAAALDDAAKAGVVHGDLSPERIFFDREGGASGRFVLEGYGVPWPVRPSEFSAPERISGASFAADIFSWARTVKHLSGPLPGDLRDLLDRCLSADPGARPHAREVRSALERYAFGAQAPKPNPQAHRDTSAFEHYAEDYDEDDPDAEQGSLAAELGNLTLPPKTFKLKEYRRQQTVTQLPKQNAASGPVPESTPEPAPPKPTPKPTSEPAGAAPSLTPRASKAHSANPESPLPTGLLRQLDATEAYKARLAAHNARHGAKDDVQNGDDPTTTPPAPAVLKVTQTQETTSAAEPSPPRVRVQRDITVIGTARPKGDSSAQRDEPDDFGGDTFEVIDDINDRAPDPTLYRGGRRVLLLTLLGIALLVLLALQLINA